MRIFLVLYDLVQPEFEPEGVDGYCYGLLQAGHPDVLISFDAFQGKRTTIFRTDTKWQKKEKKERHTSAEPHWLAGFRFYDGHQMYDSLPVGYEVITTPGLPMPATKVLGIRKAMRL